MNKLISIAILILLMLMSLGSIGSDSAVQPNINKKLEWIKSVLSEDVPALEHKKEVFDSLSFFAKSGLGESYYLLGEIYYFGLYGEKNIVKAKKYFRQGVALDDTDSTYILAMINLNEDGGDLEEAIKFLELTSGKGHEEAVVALYLLRQKELYKNSDTLKSLMAKEVFKEKEKVQVCRLYLLYSTFDYSNTSSELDSILNILSDGSFDKYLAEVKFFEAKLYGDEKLPIYDREKRNRHLKTSAELGLEAAQTLLDGYQERIKQEQIRKSNN